MRRWRKTPRGRYCEQRNNAIKRGIAWQFTFETWWELWQRSGKWEQRGRARNRYVMGRFNDVGPYHPDNCKIIKLATNTAERNKHEIERRRYEAAERARAKLQNDEGVPF